jgi:two-component system response regulator FixJ
MDILPGIASNVYFYFEDIQLYISQKDAFKGLDIHYRCLEVLLNSEQRLEIGIHVVCMRQALADTVGPIGKVASDNPQVRIILVVSQISARLVASAFNSGVADVIVDAEDTDRLLGSLNVVDLELFAATKKAQRIAEACAKLNLLSPREKCVLNGILAGKQNKQIAANLELSVRTVEMFRATLMHKLEIRSVADAVKLSLSASKEMA